MTRWIGVIARLLLAKLWVQANQPPERGAIPLLKCMVRFGFLLFLAFLEIATCTIYMAWIGIRRRFEAVGRDVPTLEE